MDAALQKLKDEVHQLVDRSTDSRQLAWLKHQLASTTQADWWDTATTAEREVVRRGMAQAGRGEVISLNSFIEQARTEFPHAFAD